MDLIPNDWKHLLKAETSKNLFQKLSVHYYKNKDKRNVKDFRKISNKEIYFTLQSKSTKYNKPSKFISLPNTLFSALKSGVKLS